MNYRKFYEEECNIKIPKGYEIHHIDMNRENNNIENLVMLPKKLHKQYHFYLSMIKSFPFEISTKITSIIEGGRGYNDWLLNEFFKRVSKFNEVWEKCCEWNDYKYFLLDCIPNIHGIEVDSDGCVEESEKE